MDPVNPLYRLVTPLANNVPQLVTALEQQQGCAKLCPYWLTTNYQGQGLVPHQIAMIEGLPGDSLKGRLQSLLKLSLFPLLQTLTFNGLACMLILPPLESVRGQAFPLSAVYQYLIEHVPMLATTPLILLTPETAITALMQAQTWIQEGHFQQILFGGIDSFIALSATRELEKQVVLRQWSYPEGRLPSEAAAFVVLDTNSPKLIPAPKPLQPTSDQHAQPLTPSEQAFHSEHGSHSEQASCSGPFSHQKSLSLSQLISDRDITRKAEAAWYRDLKTDYPQAIQATEWCTQKNLGHIGAAQLPLQLILGWYFHTQSLHFGSVGLFFDEQLLMLRSTDI